MPKYSDYRTTVILSVFKSGNYTAKSNEYIWMDTSGGSRTVTLPATPIVGANVRVGDASQSAETNNITIGRNGNTINGVAEDFVIDRNNGVVDLIWNGTTWAINIPTVGTGGINEAQVVNIASGIETEQFRPYDWRVSSSEATRGYIGPSSSAAKFDSINTSGSGTGYHWVQMPWVFPEKWNSGQVRFRILWAPSSTNTGDIVFSLLFTAISEGDPGDISLSNNGPQLIDSGLGTANVLHWSPWSPWTGIDPAGDIGYGMRLQGQASNPDYTFTGTCQQILCQMQWISNAPTDD